MSCKYTQKPRAIQTSLLDLYCRGATGYAAQPNIAEAESRASFVCIAEALQDMRRSVALTCLDWKQDVGQ